MRSVTCSLGFVLAVFASISQVRADDDIANAWLVAPPVVKVLGPEDRKARDEVVRLIDTKQEMVYRQQSMLEIPQRASGVPANYDLVLYRTDTSFGDYGGTLDIKVRNGQAKLTLCDRAGIFRIERPAPDIDRPVRQLAYAFHRVERERKQDPEKTEWFGGGFVWQSHTSHYTIEVISRDEKLPFHLKTPAWQPLADEISLMNNGLPGFAHARLVAAVDKLAERECQLIPAEEESREILRRLKAVPTDRYEESFRADRPAVERFLFGSLAANRNLAQALPELKRLELRELHQQLEITSSDNPEPRIKQAILAHEKDMDFAQWAIEFAQNEAHPERVPWLVDLLGQDLPNGDYYYGVRSILSHLSQAKLNKEQIGKLEKFYANVDDPIVKIDAAGALLFQTQRKDYFDFLETQVRALPPDPKAKSARQRRAAANQLLTYAAKSGKQRAEALAVLKMLLKEPRETSKPDSFEMFELVEFLGDLGTPEDVPYLSNLAQSSSYYLASFALDALAKLDSRQALDLLHRRIEQWNKGAPAAISYSHEIFPHFELLIFERDVSAIPLLKRAWERLSKAEPRRPVEACYDPKFVVAFLEAKTGAVRAEAAIAHFGDRAYLADQQRMRRLVKQLIAEGADPERCKLLLQEPDQGRRGR